MLESLGYRSIVVTSPAEALETLNRTAGIALMFSDVVMPGGMNGLMLAREAMRQHPKALSAGPASCCKPRCGAQGIRLPCHAINTNPNP